MSKKGYGVSVTQALSNAFTTVKDLASSLGTLTKAFAYFITRTLYAASYIVNSFDVVGNFLYRFFFETRTITWDDMVNVSFPFLVVTSILGFIVYRANRKQSIPSFPEVTCDYEKTPRRSARLARKRALLECDSALFASQKAPLRTTNL